MPDVDGLRWQVPHQVRQLPQAAQGAHSFHFIVIERMHRPYTNCNDPDSTIHTHFQLVLSTGFRSLLPSERTASWQPFLRCLHMQSVLGQPRHHINFHKAAATTSPQQFERNPSIPVPAESCLSPPTAEFYPPERPQVQVAVAAVAPLPRALIQQSVNQMNRTTASRIVTTSAYVQVRMCIRRYIPRKHWFPPLHSSERLRVPQSRCPQHEPKLQPLRQSAELIGPIRCCPHPLSLQLMTLLH